MLSFYSECWRLLLFTRCPCKYAGNASVFDWNRTTPNRQPTTALHQRETYMGPMRALEREFLRVEIESFRKAAEYLAKPAATKKMLEWHGVPGARAVHSMLAIFLPTHTHAHRTDTRMKFSMETICWQQDAAIGISYLISICIESISWFVCMLFRAMPPTVALLLQRM